MESIEIAELEIRKILKNHAAVIETKNAFNDASIPSDDSVAARPRFPPGYGGPFLKNNHRFSHTDAGRQSQTINSLNSEVSIFDFGLKNNDTNNPEDDIRLSTTSTLCEPMTWQTIKGGKAVQEDPIMTKRSKKKKKKQKNGTADATLESISI